MAIPCPNCNKKDYMGFCEVCLGSGIMPADDISAIARKIMARDTPGIVRVFPVEDEIYEPHVWAEIKKYWGISDSRSATETPKWRSLDDPWEISQDLTEPNSKNGL